MTSRSAVPETHKLRATDTTKRGPKFTVEFMTKKTLFNRRWGIDLLEKHYLGGSWFYEEYVESLPVKI